MKEIVIISGKGGTGKTSLTASFICLAKKSAIADCDVDAADLHLLLDPDIRRRTPFYSGNYARIRQEDCLYCGLCKELCRFGAIREKHGNFFIDVASCEGCGVCERFCPNRAIDFPERLCGEWMLSETCYGPMVHARLGTAAENSGKLVSLVRREVRRVAEERGLDTIFIDGPPGIGCPVIASLTNASLAVVITEPTLCGQHDMQRVLELTRHFSIPSFVCVNKWDINPEMTANIEKLASASNVGLLGRIRYDPAVTKAQLHGLVVAETSAPSGEDIVRVWDSLRLALVKNQ